MESLNNEQRWSRIHGLLGLCTIIVLSFFMLGDSHGMESNSYGSSETRNLVFSDRLEFLEATEIRLNRVINEADDLRIYLQFEKPDHSKELQRKLDRIDEQLDELTNIYVAMETVGPESEWNRLRQELLIKVKAVERLLDSTYQ